jgi:glycosyltransferase involved in cell wall biosynthesis
MSILTDEIHYQIPSDLTITYSKELALNNTYDNTVLRIKKFQENNTNAVVTFIIPTIDRPSLIRTILSLLDQTNSRWNAIIIFDGCEPQISNFNEMIRDPRFLSICINRRGSNKIHDHSSAGAVRNIGMNLVTTPWIGFVDDDDFLHSEYVNKLIEEISVTPNAHVISFRMKDKNKIIPPIGHQSIQFGYIGISFAMKTVLFKNGFLFIQSEKEDFDLLNHIQQSGNTIVLSPYLTYFINYTNLSSHLIGATRYIIHPK